jgi:cyclopropane-fatty-acyl-phospholipid synthase
MKRRPEVTNMTLAIDIAERGLLPDPILRAGIRRLVAKRLRDETARHGDDDRVKSAWVRHMASAPIAPVPELANAQHYEVPAEFYQIVLGSHLKYSSAFFPPGVQHLDDAEAAMLSLTAERAGLADGQRILELGCGWGSLSLWMAAHYPGSRIVAVSNSRSQREFIEDTARRRGLSNLTVLTADMNAFEAAGPRFDRVVSVEMFEHMRNWPSLLGRVRRWLADDGRVFIHVFAHRKYAYPFETSASDDWMGRHFFSGGMMPSLDLFDRIPSPFVVEQRHEVPGVHYQKTAEAWLDNLDAHQERVEALFARDLGRRAAKVQVERWRMFFMACAELFGFGGGREWLVAHYLLAPKTDGAGS